VLALPLPHRPLFSGFYMPIYVIDNYVGEIGMIESKHKLRVDQEELETIEKGVYDGRVIQAIEYEDICKVMKIDELEAQLHEAEDIVEDLREELRAYRISGFSCEQTAPWERTLENPTSLSIMILDDDSFEMSVVWTLVDDCGLRMPYHVNLKVEVGATRHVLCKLESNGIANGVVQTSKNSHGFTSLQIQICPRRNARVSFRLVL
ncbi:DNA/RNA-binding protein Kin17, partial [Tanacetum coccineum]